MQGLRAALEIACILAVVGSRSVQLAGTLVLASPLAAPAIKALCTAIQVGPWPAPGPRLTLYTHPGGQGQGQGDAQ